MMERFVFAPLPGRVVFGAGTLDRLAEEVAGLAVRRALVLCTPEQRATAEDVAQRLGAAAAGVYDRAVMHVPIEVAEAARTHAAERGADGYVAVGGGSTIGLGKAIALVSGQPVIAVPTTYAGSEMTPIWGLTQHGEKTTGRDLRVLPRVVIYDPTLTVSLPPRLSGVSGMNAIAHCVEALYAENGNPIAALMAEEGIAALAGSLPGIMAGPGRLDLRTRALYGAWLAGSVLGAVGMALHHKLCHVLGGTLNLPHAETHTAVLPHAAAYNAAAAPDAMRRVARALGAESAAQGLYDLANALGAQTALRHLGMREEDIPRVADLATANPYANPAPVTRDGMLALLRNAWEGRRPDA